MEELRCHFRIDEPPGVSGDPHGKISKGYQILGTYFGVGRGYGRLAHTISQA